MTTVRIDSDEWYPVYFETKDGDPVEVDDEVAARWRRVAAEFDLVQEEMKLAQAGRLA